MSAMEVPSTRASRRFANYSLQQKVTFEQSPAEEMLKMKIDPTMCMKTKDRTTKCRVKKQTFSAIEP
jgi:hypothetical protein